MGGSPDRQNPEGFAGARRAPEAKILKSDRISKHFARQELRRSSARPKAWDPKSKILGLRTSNRRFEVLGTPK